MSHLIRCYASRYHHIAPIARYKVLTEVPYSPKPVPTDWDFELLAGIRVRFHDGNLDVGQTETYPGYSLYSDARFCGVAFNNSAVYFINPATNTIMSFPKWQTKPNQHEAVMKSPQHTIVRYDKRIVNTQFGSFVIICGMLYFNDRYFRDIPINGYISAIWKIDAGLIFLLRITCRVGSYVVIVDNNNPGVVSSRKVKRAIRIKIIDPEKY